MQYVHQSSNHFGGNLEEAAISGSPQRFLSSLVKAVLATALFRCWHILLFFTAWATAITLINEKVADVTIQPTLLTVIGTVLGFVISYRTTSSFERYNEGRRYWSQIILATRTLARAVWFHVPELAPPTEADENRSEEERKARVLVEKKTVINLIEAFSVAVKHYLRGEEGINYVDLYHLVKFLPSYAFPAGLIPEASASRISIDPELEKARPSVSVTSVADVPLPPSPPPVNGNTGTNGHATGYDASDRHVTLELPQPAIAKGPVGAGRTSLRISTSARSHISGATRRGTPRRATFNAGTADDTPPVLLPASMPPKYSIFDIFPFSLLIKMLTRGGREVEGKKAARYRAKSAVVTHNVPLEISMYLTSYVSALQARKAVDAPTISMMLNTIIQLTDALTGLERILTTPIPFSYSIHLWLVTIIYCLALPFQVWKTLQWFTIPGTAIASFIFFGFLVAGEEIENPFGYDKNDLNMDHFTHNIIRSELLALTAFPPPDPADWAFSSRNDCLFAGCDAFDGSGAPRDTATPEEWVARGTATMKSAMAYY